MARKVLELDYRQSYEAKAQSLLTLVADDKPNILFVCRGNICRSPFAEYYCQQKLAYPHVRSAGTLPLSRRMSSTTAAEVARKHFGLEFDKHRSKRLTPDLLSWAHVIIVMDFKVLKQLQGMKTPNKPVFVLSSQQRLREVCDPFLKDVATHLAVYMRIRDELERIFHRDKIHLAA